jgi:sec-independent protein translocase protein TatA
MAHPVLLFIGSPWQLLVVLIVVLMLFGKRLPDLMRSLGASMTEFKKGIKEGNEGDDSADPGK